MANALRTLMVTAFLVFSSAGIADATIPVNSPATAIDNLKHAFEAACTNTGLDVVERGSHHVTCSKAVDNNDVLMSTLPDVLRAYGQPTRYIAFTITSDGTHLTTSMQRWISIKDVPSATAIAGARNKLQEPVITTAWEAR